MLTIYRTLSATGKGLLTGFSVAVICSILLRLVNADGSVILADVQQYAFGALILTAIAVAFYANRHVRVELLSSVKSENANPVLSIFWLVIGVILPSIAIFVLSLPGAYKSWQLLEGSREPGGLPGYFLIKSLLPLFCVALTLFALEKIRNLVKSTGH